MSTGQTNLLQVLQKRVETLQGEGKLEDALRVSQTAVDAARRNVASDSNTMPRLVSTLLMLADLRRMVSDFDGAESVYLEGLSLAAEMTQNVANVDAPNLEIARLQSGLASLYDFTSREERAIPLYEEAIQRFEVNDPPELEEAAYLCNNVGMIYKQMDEYPAAEAFYKKALQIFETNRGASHHSVGTVYNNLGGLYTAMEAHDKAREAHSRAMKIREQAFPRNHPDLGQSLCNMATVYHQLNDFNNARKHYEAALRLFEKNLDDTDEDYTILMNNYAQLLRDHGQEKKAEALEKRIQGRLRKLDEKRYEASA
ncbi:MAG: tetratricopeptide (TPR) repeat protein [Verrucomicrobiales bacterium]|jgi:tetratricopeptide (TPR) repeat protein